MISVELLKDGVVERCHLRRRSDDLSTEVRLKEAKGLQRAAELRAGEHTVAVQIQRRKAFVHPTSKRRLVLHEGPHSGAIQDYYSHAWSVIWCLSRVSLSFSPPERALIDCDK